ncbi:S-layer homology domain-containing protein [Planococcus sp. 107-1]|uniref:S-layer homology domain-containing protein n=1 Tax=Planococcus sp. 107-1 TaxID=2908840 RepID=UPI0037C527F1
MTWRQAIKHPLSQMFRPAYADAVNALVANDVTDGLTPTQFGVSRNITRGQLAVFIYRLVE